VITVSSCCFSDVSMYTGSPWVLSGSTSDVIFNPSKKAFPAALLKTPFF